MVYDTEVALYLIDFAMYAPTRVGNVPIPITYDFDSRLELHSAPAMVLSREEIVRLKAELAAFLGVTGKGRERITAYPEETVAYMASRRITGIWRCIGRSDQRDRRARA